MIIFRIRYCVVGCNRFYVFGGYCSDDDLFFVIVECYDYVRDRWFCIVFMNYRRVDVCVVSV